MSEIKSVYEANAVLFNIHTRILEACESFYAVGRFHSEWRKMRKAELEDKTLTWTTEALDAYLFMWNRVQDLEKKLQYAEEDQEAHERTSERANRLTNERWGLLQRIKTLERMSDEEHREAREEAIKRDAEWEEKHQYDVPEVDGID